MKKLMIATSAMVGLGLVSADFAAAQVETSLSGSVRIRLQNTGLDNSNIDLNMNRARLTWKADGTSDAGLTYGAQVRIDNGETGDDNIYFGGGFGTVTIGETGGHGDLSNGAEAASAGSGGIDGGVNLGSGVAGVVGHDIDAHLSTSPKIAYASPSFGGLSVGVSYAPDTDGKGTSDDGYDVSLAYSGSFGDTSVKAHLVHSQTTTVTAASVDRTGSVTFKESVSNGATIDLNFNGTTPEEFVVVTAADVPETLEKVQATGLGVSAGFGPITAGASYVDNDDDKVTMAGALKYSFGDGAVSLGYASSEDKSAAAKNKATSIILSADYTVAPGWSVAVDVAKNDGENGNAEDSSTSWLLQSVVSF